MNQQVKVASICMPCVSNKAQNLSLAKKLILESCSKGADWVVLPEMFTYMGPSTTLWDQAENIENSEVVEWLAQTAKSQNIVLFAGSIPERCDSINPRVYNTSLVFERNKGLIGRYRKIHLFNLNTGDAKTSYKESDSYAAGDSPVQLKIDGFRVLIAICYDLRFPGLFQCSTAANTDVMILPSAFTKKTGEAHWHTLIKARSLDMQAYTVAANQTGVSYAGRETFGHSLICDPWGSILDDTKDIPGIALATLSRVRLQEVREKLPVLKNLRPELY